MNSVIFAFIHHLAFLLLFACVFYEHLNLSSDIDSKNALRLIRIDIIYGISAAVVLTAGILRVLYFEKGSDYYLSNWAFYVKIGLFIMTGILSIYPTKLFLSWRKQIANAEALVFDQQKIKLAIMIVRIELLLLVLMLPPAALMAKGHGVLH